MRDGSQAARAGLLSLLLAAPAAAASGFPEQVAEALRWAREAARAALPREAASPRSPREFLLRVLCYNINGTPLGPKERHNRYRETGRILAELRRRGEAPHIVAIQEAFHSRTKELVLEAGYPHVRAGEGPKEGHTAGSGLYILSEFPIESAETIDYTSCAGWDCFANKGALRARVRVPGLPGALEIYNTHMNADDTGGGADHTLKARLEQIAQLSDFIRRTLPAGSAAILPGDFNFKPQGPDYRLFAGFSRIRNAAEECARSRSCSGDLDPGGIWRGFVDHQFYLAGAEVSPAPAHVAQTFKEPVNGAPLSDHLGLEIHFRLSSP